MIIIDRSQEDHGCQGLPAIFLNQLYDVHICVQYTEINYTNITKEHLSLFIDDNRFVRT